MNPKKTDIDRFLETYVPAPSIEDMETDSARVLRRLKSERRAALSGDLSSTPAGNSVIKVSRPWWQPVAAAVLIGMVGIGLYAAQQSGFFSPRQVVPPMAQSPASSEKGSAQTTQDAAPMSALLLPPASTKPGAAPSREEALARAAAQIAAAQATDAGAARPKFATASVRPGPIFNTAAPVPASLSRFQCLGVDGLLRDPEGTVSPTARRGRCSGQAVDLRDVVLAAYGTYPPIPFVTGAGERLTGFPDSLRGRGDGNMRFQIEAIADDPEHVTKGELKLMLQTLLEDRFKARVHLEMREVDGYVLTIAKSGIKFKETSLDPKPPCDYNGRLARPVEIFVRGTCRMKELTTHLSKLLLPLNIADKTGLMGIYNIDFALEPIYLSAPTGGGVRGAGGPSVRQFTTPIPKALEEQLGLDLERTKIPEEFVVVDHLEQPTEN